jgi:pachytene checkpoint protein 2
MNGGSAFHDGERPKGIQRIRQLPDEALGQLWDSIIIDEGTKERLLSQAALNFTMRGKVPRSVIPLHGVIMLTGLPGTGKTSLARGLAHRVAASFKGARFRLLEVEPHSLASAAHGKTQRAVTDLFAQSIAEAAAAGPTVVLLDEVETLAADRAKLSLEANPVDVHRATDAVLVQLDALAEDRPQLLFVATSNFPQAVDDAFLSRCDLIVEVPLPDETACARILSDCLSGLGAAYPAIGRLAGSAELAKCAAACVGLDGRAIRKVVANALAADRQTAMEPERLTMAALLGAARAAHVVRTKRPAAAKEAHA